MGKTIKIMLLSAALFGCDKVNQENYKKIATGMKYQDVITILGEPDNCQEMFLAKSCQWGTETREIDIKFIGDEVMLYASVGLQ